MRHVLILIPVITILLTPAAYADGTASRPLGTAPPQGTAHSAVSTPGFRGFIGEIGTPGQQCRAAIRAVEREAGIPRQLMAAIARVESGRPNGNGGVDPWPWSINAEGTDHVYDTKAAAIAGVRAFQAAGVRSIDVGCMQVNLIYHPDAFASLEQAFDPHSNAQYAARFLGQLYAKAASWPAATAGYHSGTPELGSAYERKVASVWPDELRRDDGPPEPVWAASPGGIGSGAGGALMLGNRSEAARIIPMGAGALSRGLDAYRSAPIPIASRLNGRAPL